MKVKLLQVLHHDENEAIGYHYLQVMFVVIYTKGADGAAVYLKNAIISLS